VALLQRPAYIEIGNFLQREVGSIIITSSANHSRLSHARAWLETRSPAEEILILAAADAGNELARNVARTKGAAFGWHRLSLSQFAAVLAAPLLATSRVVALGNLGVQAMCARVVHELAGNAALGRYSEIAACLTPSCHPETEECDHQQAVSSSLNGYARLLSASARTVCQKTCSFMHL
jgi:hypothetical protein